jgi:hypothetical protein
MRSSSAPRVAVLTRPIPTTRVVELDAHGRDHRVRRQEEGIIPAPRKAHPTLARSAQTGLNPRKLMQAVALDGVRTGVNSGALRRNGIRRRLIVPIKDTRVDVVCPRSLTDRSGSDDEFERSQMHGPDRVQRACGHIGGADRTGPVRGQTADVLTHLGSTPGLTRIREAWRHPTDVHVTARASTARGSGPALEADSGL